MIYVILAVGIAAVIGGYYLGKHNALATVKAEISRIESMLTDPKSVVEHIKSLL